MRVIPLHLGKIVRDKSAFTYLRNMGSKQEFPVIAWLVETGDSKIVIDTGTDSPEHTSEPHRPLIRTKEQEMAHVLARLNVDPLEVKVVILTHLHWDHCWNNGLFPNAEFYVQRDELVYALAPLPVHYHAYDVQPILETRYIAVDGDRTIAPGIRLILTPGHTPGCQSVLLEGEKRILIAGDTIPLFENWYNDSFPLPNGVHVSVADYYSSFEKMKDLNPGLILPGHDWKVFDKSEYPV